MNILVATNETQKARASDFCWTDEGEMVVSAAACDRDLRDPNPDGGCGCGRSMCGMISHKATTTFKVAASAMTGSQFTDAYLGSMQDSGWLTGNHPHKANPAEGSCCICRECMRREFAAAAADLLRIAAAFPVGTILEKRKDNIHIREIKNSKVVLIN